MTLAVLVGRAPVASRRAGAGHASCRTATILRDCAVVTALVLAASCVIATRPFARVLSLVVRGADIHGPIRVLANIGTVPVADRIIAVPLKQGSIRGHLYLPLRAASQTVLLVPGLQVAGIDDPRIVRLARALASGGANVLTPDIPELSRFEITPGLTDQIEQAAL